MALAPHAADAPHGTLIGGLRPVAQTVGVAVTRD